MVFKFPFNCRHNLVPGNSQRANQPVENKEETQSYLFFCFWFYFDKLFDNLFYEGDEVPEEKEDNLDATDDGEPAEEPHG